MIKKHILMIGILFPIVTLCQTTTGNETKAISLGLILSPDYGYRTLKADADKWIVDGRDSMELPNVGFTIGAGLLYSLSEHFTLESGLLYSDKGEKTKWYTDLVYNQPDPFIPTGIRYIYHYRYLEIPVKANYNLLSKKFKIFISGGVSLDVFAGQKTIAISEFKDGHTEERSSSRFIGDAAPITLTMVAGMGFQYSLSEKISLRVEPLYRHSITSATTSVIKGYFYSGGINLGVYYKIH